MSPTVLDHILASTREEVARRRAEVPLDELRRRIADAEADSADAGRRRHRFRDALTAPGIAVIAEFKRRSPSVGELRPGADVGEIVGAYQRGGARAVSVLTEGRHFDGALPDLVTARAACALPLLRKDFVIDEYQLHEALLAGADALLLIVAALDQPLLSELHVAAGELGLDVLVEVHDREELRRALEIEAELIGINNRDLRDFSVDVGRTFELLESIPPGVAAVSESGIGATAQLRELQDAGVKAVLVGETLMRASDPAAALRALLGTETAAASGI